jgi:hypothetical protein
MSPAIPDRLAILDTLSLDSGAHDSLDAGSCVMEAVAYVAGEPWADHPKCACPVLTSFMIAWNDALPDNETRDRLLKPYVLRLIDTKSTPAVEERRSYMALDWLIRVHTPKWLDMVPSLAPHAKKLRDLEEIVDMAGATAASTLTSSAQAAAWDAACAAAGEAAWAFLRPTTELLQASAQDLVDRMIAAGAA